MCVVAELRAVEVRSSHQFEEEIGAASSENGVFIAKMEFSVRTGIPKTLVTPGGTEIESFGHEVTIQTLGITLTSVIYFAKYPGITRNFLGRVGWLRNLRFCVALLHESE
jgi:hypothetical protein